MKTSNIIRWSIIGFIGVIVIIAAIDLGTGWLGVFRTKTFGKEQENANREVFKQTQSYNDGMAQELAKIKLEYEQAKDTVDKNALAFKVRHDYANFNEKNLESESLRSWLIKIRGF